MANMMRGTRGFCTGCGTLLAMAVFVGCAQSGQNSQQTTRQASTSTQTSPLDSAAAAAGSVVSAATGAATGAVNGAVNGATGGAGAKPAKKRPRIKSNGRGGYDASELQKDAIRRSHAISARYGVTKVTRARNGVLAGSPTTRPTTQGTR